MIAQLIAIAVSIVAVVAAFFAPALVWVVPAVCATLLLWILRDARRLKPSYNEALSLDANALLQRYGHF